ncbi:methyltransferase domain-containing protein [Ottowia sp. GY511]|uniref:Methyltransferase domain-containing protein n=1 Tax=Ottowia flava TaxID=2675430 RepID=A0ABW4KQ12_9BURK|nr:class I SAM-dependent methyltransferase [Ottowia sp. GY511]TXK32962.1 methyltransferase domain-containing protein [Ottowia sp. GY511]
MTTPERYNYAFDPDGEDWPARLLRQVPPGASILELGPGPGAMTNVMMERGHAVTVVENDPHAVAALKSRGVEIIEADLNALDWREQLHGRTFGALLACDVLEHLHDPAATLLALRDLAEPAARLVISMPNVAYAGLVAGLRLGMFEYADTGLLDRTHMRFFTRSSLGRLLMTTGWASEHWEGLHLPVEASEFVWAWQQLDEASRQALVSGWPEFDVYEWMTVATPQADASTARIRSADEDILRLRKALQALTLRHQSEYDSLVEHQKAFSEAKIEIERLGVEVENKVAAIESLKEQERTARSEVLEREQQVSAQDAEIQRLHDELEWLKTQGWPGRLRRLLQALRS